MYYCMTHHVIYFIILIQLTFLQGGKLQEVGEENTDVEMNECARGQRRVRWRMNRGAGQGGRTGRREGWGKG